MCNCFVSLPSKMPSFSCAQISHPWSKSTSQNIVLQYVLYRRGNCEWKAHGHRLQISQHRRKNADLKKLKQNGGLFDSNEPSVFSFHFVIKIPNSLRQQQGETVYPCSQTVNLSPCRTPLISIQGEGCNGFLNWPGVNIHLNTKWAMSTMVLDHAECKPKIQRTADHWLSQPGIAKPHVA